MKFITYNNYHYIHRLSKRITPFFKKNNRFDNVFSSNDKLANTNDTISKIIINKTPSMIARYGSVESRAILNFTLKNKKLNDITAIYKHFKGDLNIFWKHENSFLDTLVSNAGFFPNDEMYLSKFVDLMFDCSKNVDILGVWNGYEEYLPIPQKTSLCKIRELEPWFFKKPWSTALKGKKVLVIHPFEDDIKNQYLNKDLLYKNSKVLPEFELKTIKAVQTIAGEKSKFNNWFEALESMKTKMNNIDFDVAIIGCGAYGFPLASHAKKLGKIGIHLGGVTQLLFGIKGKRWEEWEHYKELRLDDGKHWIFPSEKPQNYKKIEHGCYW